MNPEEEIKTNIIEMGYVLATLRNQYPSYYKLYDGTILRIIVQLNYAIPDAREPDGFSVDTTNIVSCFVSREKRRPDAFVPFNQSELYQNIIEEDVEYEVLRENFSVYDLSNGFVISVKPVLGQVKRTKFYAHQGEPVYTVNINPIIKIKQQK
jgi:hypothetical protein